MLRILTEHIEKFSRLETRLFLISICSIIILNTLEVMAKTSFRNSQNAQPWFCKDFQKSDLDSNWSDKS